MPQALLRRGKGWNLNLQPEYGHWHAHWLLGLIGEETVDVKRVCPSGNATIQGGGTSIPGATKDPLIMPLRLSASEKSDLVSFLQALTGAPIAEASRRDTSAP